LAVQYKLDYDRNQANSVTVYSSVIEQPFFVAAAVCKSRVYSFRMLLVGRQKQVYASLLEMMMFNSSYYRYNLSRDLFLLSDPIIMRLP
jgi:hypothetical protein